jgi:intein/homing endonuclease
MAYVVGLTATDGCLVSGRRKINFKSAARDLVGLYLLLLRRTNKIKEGRTRAGGTVYFTEFGDARLYRWFESIGLTPRKSLTLGGLDVPDMFLAPLLRGLFEGDGTIQNFRHHPTLRAQPSYVYERLWTYFERLARRPDRHDFFRLKFGNRESITLLRVLYASADVPRLERKWKVWDDYATRHGLC